MALTLEQEQALLALLDEQKLTLSELDSASELNSSDLMLVRQGILDKSLKGETLKRYVTPPAASLTTFGLTKLSSAVNSNDEDIAATSKAVKSAYDLAGRALVKESNLADLTNVADALANLGLGNGSELPIGIPVPYPLAVPPVGWLKCNGAAFSKALYPKLALCYPSGLLPDLRGEFIRGWDDGRGVDAGRDVYSCQDYAVETHAHGISMRTGGPLTLVTKDTQSGGVQFPAASQGDGGSIYSEHSSGTVANHMSFGTDNHITIGKSAGETRPRNVSFNYILRAV